MTSTVTTDLALLSELPHDAPFQPATQFWRAVEIAKLVEHGLPQGFGLDLGCGDGKLTNLLLGRTGFRELVGVDVDPFETAQAERLPCYVRVHTTNAAEVPEPDETFDFVFSNSVMEHIPDIFAVLAEMARIMKRGAKFVFTVPSDGFHRCLAGPLFAGARRASYLAEIDRRCAHKRYWSADVWAAELSRHGISVLNTKEYLHRGQVQRWETLSRFTGGILYSLWGQTRQPIEIQRALGLRRAGLQCPWPIARILAKAIAAGVKTNSQDTGYGCLLVETEKA